MSEAQIAAAKLLALQFVWQFDPRPKHRRTGIVEFGVVAASIRRSGRVFRALNLASQQAANSCKRTFSESEIRNGIRSRIGAPAGLS
jgi:hypothetical protein